MYDGINKTMSPTTKITAPLTSATGETIQDKGKQMEQWVELYFELYSRKNHFADDVLDAVKSFPSMVKLDKKSTM